MFCSPLRYPGGKGKLTPFMEYMIKNSGHLGGTYIEPFAGGAGIALELLQKGIVSRVVINDYDKGVWSFWRAILSETDRFIEELRTVPLTVDEWDRQRAICLNQNKKYSFELGFATFYMNRTNRSGIIKGGVIGGQNQAGPWKMDVRFNREDLILRIQNVSQKKNSIKLYNKDINSFIERYIPKYADNAFVYFDPPYYGKGKQLYMNFFSHNDHVRIESTIREHVNCDWIITYDDIPAIREIYKDYDLYLYDLNYSVSAKCKASEIMVFGGKINPPSDEELQCENASINLRRCEKMQ